MIEVAQCIVKVQQNTIVTIPADTLQARIGLDRAGYRTNPLARNVDSGAGHRLAPMSRTIFREVGVTGALAATWFGTRLGRIIPLAAGIAIVAVSLVLPYGLSSQNLFVLSAFLFKYGWWFISQHLLANMTALDTSGRLITATNIVIAFGRASGPFVVGLFLVEAPTGGVIDYSPAVTTGLVSFVFCYV